MHIDQVTDDFRAPCLEEANFRAPPRSQSEPLAPFHVEALGKCLKAIHAIIETFLGHDLDTVRALPIFHFVRVAYAVVCLTKMYFAVTSANCSLANVISRDDLQVERHLDALLESFRAAAQGNKCRPASKFLIVLVMLKAWFQKPKGGAAKTVAGPGTTDGSSTTVPPGGIEHCMLQDAMAMVQRADPNQSAVPRAMASFSQGLPTGNAPGRFTPSNHNKPQRSGTEFTGVVSNYNTANTPLQLLSEVAMGGSNGLVDCGGGDAAAASRFGSDGQTPPSSAPSNHSSGLQGRSGNARVAAVAATAPPSTSSAEYGAPHTSSSSTNPHGEAQGTHQHQHQHIQSKYVRQPSSLTSTSNAIPIATPDTSQAPPPPPPPPTTTTTTTTTASPSFSLGPAQPPPYSSFQNDISYAVSSGSTPNNTTLGDGFGQALGMTLGDEDFSSTLLDDIFSYRLSNDSSAGGLSASAAAAAGGGGGGLLPPNIWEGWG